MRTPPPARMRVTVANDMDREDDLRALSTPTVNGYAPEKRSASSSPPSPTTVRNPSTTTTKKRSKATTPATLPAPSSIPAATLAEHEDDEVSAHASHFGPPTSALRLGASQTMHAYARTHCPRVVRNYAHRCHNHRRHAVDAHSTWRCNSHAHATSTNMSAQSIAYPPSWRKCVPVPCCTSLVRTRPLRPALSYTRRRCHVAPHGAHSVWYFTRAGNGHLRTTRTT